MIARYADFDINAVDRGGSYWAHLSTQALAEGRFSWFAREVRALQEKLEAEAAEALRLAYSAYGDGTGDASARAATPLLNHAFKTLQQSWQLFDGMILRYHDGFVQIPGGDPASIGYPKTWLRQVGYASDDADATIAGATELEPNTVPLLVSLPPFTQEQTQHVSAAIALPQESAAPSLGSRLRLVIGASLVITVVIALSLRHMQSAVQLPASPGLWKPPTWHAWMIGMKKTQPLDSVCSSDDERDQEYRQM
jgi:hypothetical protein